MESSYKRTEELRNVERRMRSQKKVVRIKL